MHDSSQQNKLSSVGERSVNVEIGLITDSIVSFSRFMFYITIQTNQSKVYVLCIHVIDNIFRNVHLYSLVEFISSAVSGI